MIFNFEYFKENKSSENEEEEANDIDVKEIIKMGDKFLEMDETEKALGYYKMAIQRKNYEAAGKYAFYSRFYGYLTDDEAIDFCKKHYYKGSSDAECWYGYLLEESEKPTNKQKSIKKYKKAIDKGNSEAMRYYAKMLLVGRGIDKNVPEAVKYFKMAIDHVNTNAM